MQLRYLQTVAPAADAVSKVAHLAWSPDGTKLAAAAADRVLHLFDESGARRDRFRTKPADGNASGAYLVTGLAFSPDGAKLAVAQSDSVVFVYRLGAGWDEKKSICNKFAQSAAVSCLAWAPGRAGDVCFGLADGKVKLGMLATNKTYTLYAHPDGAAVAALAASPDGRGLVSGHADGSLYHFTFPEAQDGSGPAGCAKLAHHSCAPCALAWGESVAAIGPDCRVAFYDPTTGREQAAFEHSADEEARGFACAAVNPAGDALVVGAVDRLYVFGRGGAKGAWQAAGFKQISNMGPVTAVAWRPDGSRLAAGGLRGNVDLWDTCIRRARHKGKFKLTYVSKAAVIVKTLATGSRIVLKSVYGYEVSKVAVYQGRFIVGRTHSTLLLACLLYRGGELHVIEYGVNEVVAALRTEHMSPYLLSLAMQGARGALPDVKRLAYLMDATTARVVDFAAASATAAEGGVAGGGAVALATVAHDTRIDWLELNARGSHLLFRDKSRRLFLFDVTAQERASLLGFCQYAQWVPGSDAVVAQSRGDLCVWYGVAAPDRPAVIPIRGDVTGIERAPGRTEVLVDEGLTQAAYALDEGRIDFGAALEALDFDRAVATLEALPAGPDTDAQWRALSAAALAHEQLGVAERCAAALGDVARVEFLHKLIKQAEKAEPVEPAPAPGPAPAARELPAPVRARLAALARQWPVAESLLLAQGRVDDAVAAYKEAHRWEDALRVADAAHHPGRDELRAEHFKWLLATDQADRAGAIKEREGDVPAAIALHLRGGAPARAAQAVASHPNIAYDPALLSAVSAALAKAGLHERAGDLAAALGRPADALAAYRRGRAYRKAVELARTAAPAQVIALEEEWGDWLSSQHQPDAAVAHYIEAGDAPKAIEAAIEARQFAKAAGILEHLDPSKAVPYHKRIAQHYADSGALSEAEAFWLKAGLPMTAVDMYTKAGKWEAAQKVARAYLPEPELRAFKLARAREAEAARAWAEAERGYVAAGEVDAAIAMYKGNKMWDALVRLVGQHRREALPEAHVLAAAALQAAGQWREAERHFLEATDWRAAAAMYRSQGAWEHALRVSKAHGGAAAARQVAYEWAVSMPPEEGGALLRRLGLGDAAVEAAVEAAAFDHALQLAQARAAAPHRLAEVRLKRAMFLEDSRRFADAEGEFVAAGKPREAVDMYTHARDWEAALRVAEEHEPDAVPDAGDLAASGQLAAAESVFLRARRPDAALEMYRSAGQWDAAVRLAEAYVPARAAELRLEMAAAAGAAGGAAGLSAVLARAQAFERGNDPARAIEAYLSPNGEGAAGAELDALQRCWEAGLALAARHQRHRIGDVAAAVAARLASVGRAAAAVDALERVGDAPGAVEAALAGGLFDRARGLAAGNAALLKTVEDAHTRALVAANDADALAARGNVGAAVEMFAAQGNWARAHEMAAQSGPALAAATAARHAQLLARQGDAPAAAAVLAARGVGAEPALLAVYREVAAAVLGAALGARDAQAEQDVRSVLHRALQQLDLPSASPAPRVEAEAARALFWAAHLVACGGRAAGGGLRELAARQATAALRYVGLIPADRALYEAGTAWRAVGRPGTAFVLLNCYLDVADAIDEAAASGGAGARPPLPDDPVLAAAGVPAGAPLPAEHYADERRREEVRNYVLELSMGARAEQRLATRPCDGCGAECCEAALSCTACGRSWEACAVSGYPVGPSERVAAKSGLPARRDDWNAWVGAFGTDPVTGLPAAPMY
ncbi:intraflagellar transport protein [Raphidocelis subcapitata]|uniref:Intraflagellar transport protein n=1 Tax=Raphidocelis subcapitata TaxID=307507 RepID=A0A2V0NK92_9CHLO|nr:intraflagellar transport protein [Raphidocelis subcapitata]|eukprot:GBF87714.1 intraflagellar transport protein [Raphidocelis subcapitata]